MTRNGLNKILLVLLLSSAFAGARPAEFVEAEREADAGRFARTLQILEAFSKASPIAQWPMAERHRLAFAYFSTGNLRAAEAHWGALLCEAPEGPLAFKVAYNLALTQTTEGRDREAYATLQLVPSSAVEKEGARAKEAYLRLALELSLRAQRFLSAALIADSGLLLFRQAASRTFFAGRFQVAAAQVGAECATLREQARSREARAYLAGHACSTAAAKTASAASAESPPAIEGLVFQPYRTENPQAGQPPRLRVVGRYLPPPGWKLYCGGIPLPLSSSGRFSIPLVIAPDTAHISLLAVGPNGESATRTESFLIPDWQRFAPNHDALKGLLEEEETSGEGGAAWHFASGIGLGAVSLQQTGTADASQTLIFLEAAGRYQASERWSLFVDSRLAAFGLSSETLSMSTRYFNLGAGAGYRFALASDWSLLVQPSYQFETMLGSQALGFRDLMGPELTAVIDWRRNDDEYWQGFFGGGFRNSDTSSLSSANTTLRGGLRFARQHLSVTLDYRRDSLKFYNGTAAFGLLGLSLGYGW